MSLVSNALWSIDFPGIPMPNEVEYMDYLRLCQQKSDREHRDWTLKHIKKLREYRANARTNEARDSWDQLIEMEIESIKL